MKKGIGPDIWLAGDPSDLIKYMNNGIKGIVTNTVVQRELVQKCKCTATISGSVSWEGLLLGKPSLIFSENWHSDCGVTFFIYSVEEAKDAFLKLTAISESYVQ